MGNPYLYLLLHEIPFFQTVKSKVIKYTYFGRMTSRGRHFEVNMTLYYMHKKELWRFLNEIKAIITSGLGRFISSKEIRGGIKKFWASGIFPIQIVQCFTPNVQKCVRYWLHLGSYCWLSLFSHNTWSKIHTPIELAKWTKLSTERW